MARSGLERVVVVGGDGSLHLVGNAVLDLDQIYLGTHLQTRFVRMGRGRHVRLDPRPPFPPFDLDGEAFPPAVAS